MDQTNDQFILILTAVLRHVPDRGLEELCQRFDHLGDGHACVAALHEEVEERAGERGADG